ncbi:hypothetical protein BDW42DRAFT_136135 [Aspergillus taichungensis]|uniref:Uncharacterized protein n=1 Tax=Aspergillus taichungensis TaxID=482145 RepID=A0A2J5HNX3_9EURO|nr:hypothetical protein BDW42DRAFT_136135 [Aspergillus taichungensis]
MVTLFVGRKPSAVQSSHFSHGRDVSFEFLHSPEVFPLVLGIFIIVAHPSLHPRRSISPNLVEWWEGARQQLNRELRRPQ